MTLSAPYSVKATCENKIPNLQSSYLDSKNAIRIVAELTLEIFTLLHAATCCISLIALLFETHASCSSVGWSTKTIPLPVVLFPPFPGLLLHTVNDNN